jgi:hypothetical protein
MTAEALLAGVDAPDDPVDTPERERDEGAGGSSSGAPRWMVWAAWGIVALAVLPILINGLDGLRRPWHPAGDWAMTELRVIEVGTADTPLVGPYSRFSWNHPGPLLFWLYALPYRLIGGPSALLGAAALVNAASVAGMLGFAWRRGRLPVLVTLAAALALCTHAFGPTMLRDPWNAWVTVLPFGVLLLASWSAFEGDRAGLFTLAVIGSFLSQSHVGFVPVTVTLTVLGVAGFVRKEPGRRAPAIAAGLLVLCWLPVLVGTLTGDGNAGRLVGHFAGGGGGEATAGFTPALGVAAFALGRFQWWVPGIDTVTEIGEGELPAIVAVLALPLAGFAVATALAWRRRERCPQALSLLVVVAVAALTGLFAVSRITGGLYDYLLRWWWPLAAVWWTAVAWPIGQVLAPRVRSWSVPRWRSRAPGRGLPDLLMTLTAGGAVIVGVLGFVTARGAAEAHQPVDDWEPSMAVLSGAVSSVPRSQPVLLRDIGPLAGWAGDAVSALLAREGVDFRVDDTGINRYKFGEHRLWRGERGLPVLWVVTGNWIDDFEREGTGRLLVRYDPLTEPERTAFRDSGARLRVAFRATGRTDLAKALDEGWSLAGATAIDGVDPVDVHRVESGWSRGVPVALFEVDDVGAELPAHHI